MSVVVALADNSWLRRMTAEAIVVALEGGGGLRRDGGCEPDAAPIPLTTGTNELFP